MDFVAEENVRRFRKLLESEIDPVTRETIRMLLRQEQQKVQPLFLREPDDPLEA